MNPKLLFCGVLIFISSCREREIKSPQVDRCFENFPKDRNLEKNSWSETQAKESYTIHTGDSWTYATTVVFEKYNDLDYRLRTKRFNRDSTVTERKISKQDWDYVCSSMDSLKFWCTNPEWEKMSIDGHETTLIGKIDSHTHLIRVDDYTLNYKNRQLRDSQYVGFKRDFLKIALQFLRFGGYEGLKKPRFVVESDKSDTIKLVSYFNEPFIEFSEFYVNLKKIDDNQGTFYIKIPKKDLGKVHLIAKAVFVNGETYTYEVDLDDYFIRKIKENRQYE